LVLDDEIKATFGRTVNSEVINKDLCENASS